MHELTCAHPGRARSGAGDAFDGAIGASGHSSIALRPDLKVVLAAQPVDFRKSVHTLSALSHQRVAKVDDLLQIKAQTEVWAKSRSTIV
jgi:hypothetical protein